MKHVRRICAVLLAAVVLLPLVLLCVQAFVPPFDALMMLMPPQMTLLPIYRVAYANKLLNHQMLLYAPIAFAPFGTFFMRQWLLRWPDELTEYLRLEGGSSVKLLWYCLAPYALPGMLALFALTFTEGWNQVEQPLMLVSDSLRQPLSALLKDLSAGNPQIVFAASVASILPIALVMLAVLVQQGSKQGLRRSTKKLHAEGE